MAYTMKIRVHEKKDDVDCKGFIGVTSVGKQALQKLEQTHPAFNGKSLSEIAMGVVREVVFSLMADCELSDDVEECFQRMLEFGLDNIYSLRSKGWPPKFITSKIMRTLNLTPAMSSRQESRSKK